MYGPKLPFLLMYGSHDMRHTGFLRVDGLSRDPQDLGRHNKFPKYIYTHPTQYIYIYNLSKKRKKKGIFQFAGSFCSFYSQNDKSQDNKSSRKKIIHELAYLFVQEGKY